MVNHTFPPSSADWDQILILGLSRSGTKFIASLRETLQRGEPTSVGKHLTSVRSGGNLDHASFEGCGVIEDHQLVRHFAALVCLQGEVPLYFSRLLIVASADRVRAMP